MNITNSNGTDITIDSLFAYWVKAPQSQKLDRLELNGTIIWNTSDNTSPSDIPSESGGTSSWLPTATRIIPNGATQAFLMVFQNNLQFPGPSPDYEVHLYFNIGCQVTASQ